MSSLSLSQICRPTDEPDCPAEDIFTRFNQPKLKLIKNSYGPTPQSQKLLFDPKTGAIRPADEFVEPVTAAPAMTELAFAPYQLTRPSGLSERLAGPT
jgi:hypothetical protein